MKITGIQTEKCTGCGLCIAECAVNLFSRNASTIPIHTDPNAWCTECGHCVAVCPHDAIAYEAEERAAVKPGQNLSFEDVAGMLLGKRSVRAYKNRDIPRQELEKILEIMRFAPSGHNAQPCEYTVIKDRTMIRMLTDVTIKSFKSFKMLVKMRKLLKPFLPKALYELLADKSTALGIDDLIAQYEAGTDVIFFNAPAVMLVHVPDLGGLSYVDPTIALTHGMLAAHSLGIGTCWMGFAMMALAKHKKVMKALGIPSVRIIAGAITLGYPQHEFQRIPVRNRIKARWVTEAAG